MDVVLSGDDTERADEIKTIVSAITGIPEKRRDGNQRVRHGYFPDKRY